MNKEAIIKELKFKGIRSSGAGGQHVNKVSSKIELTFDLENSLALSVEEKELLKSKLSSKLSKENSLILFCDESRSQHRNKEIAIKRFLEIITKSLIKPKKRKSTKPSRASIRRKAENKQKQKLKKTLRKKPKLD
ncbi:ribosome-associated protein [Lutibacter sp. Hel_I_33_5]|uniref:alternative ribosome rescue aminoacyl-tRNA hydrolase ArfB n=1 Tax=Lutibacter sp. Hel_I_33_5 TaxID=1566289 RepID=UPI0011A7F0C4|nr:alternative ribosome rescue aminoacyl-tRNA hydrolase ArfB [Lutibacter sp. Hel_I_33_5]TVZ56097.1 ribosome-associated protein [Lutibacter sp. Hel_I_33_5]